MKMELAILDDEAASGPAENEEVDIHIFSHDEELGPSIVVGIVDGDGGEDVYQVDLRDVLEEMISDLDWEADHFEGIPSCAAMLREYADKLEEKVKAVTQFECGFCQAPTLYCCCAKYHSIWRERGFIYREMTE